MKKGSFPLSQTVQILQIAKMRTVGLLLYVIVILIVASRILSFGLLLRGGEHFFVSFFPLCVRTAERKSFVSEEEDP